MLRMNAAINAAMRLRLALAMGRINGKVPKRAFAIANRGIP